MAYDYTVRNAQSFISFGLGGDGPDFGTGVFTILCHVFPDVITYGPADQGTIISKDFTNYELLIYQGTISGYIGGTSNPAPSIPMSSGSWQSVGMTRTPANLTVTLREGGAVNGTTNTAAASGNQLTYLGLRFAAAATAFDGRQAEVGIWNASLNGEEIVSFHKGFSPRRIRPQSLVAYLPLVRDLQEVRQGSTVAVGSSAPSVIAHPRRYG